MALIWNWGVSTDQTPAKLLAAGWYSSNPSSTATDCSATKKHTYASDAVSDRASLRFDQGHLRVALYSPAKSVAVQGWCAAAVYNVGQWANYGTRTGLHIGDGTTEIKVMPTDNIAASSRMTLYIAGVAQASSTTYYASDAWHWMAVKYDGSASTIGASLWVDGVEAITNQTQATSAFVAADMRVGVNTMTYDSTPVGETYWADLVAWDSVSDAGHAELWCSTFPVTGDDSDSGGWTKSTGSTFYGVTAPWNVATYAEEATPLSGDNVLMTCADIATRLGISPATIHGATAHLVAQGGGDVQAIIGSTATAGTTVTTSGVAPTPAFVTSTAITVGTALKCGIKVP